LLSPLPEFLSTALSRHDAPTLNNASASPKKDRKEKKKSRKSVDADAHEAKPPPLSESSTGALP
jgi:hypothetical protein